MDQTTLWSAHVFAKSASFLLKYADQSKGAAHAFVLCAQRAEFDVINMHPWKPNVKLCRIHKGHWRPD